MRKIGVIEHITLDGVIEAPESWTQPYQDEVIQEYMAQRMAGAPGAMLWGRRTYEQMAAHWPHQTDGNPYTEYLNRARKYVVSTTLTDPEWANTTVLPDIEAVASLDAHVAVLGSGELVAALMARGLVDELLLTIHPLVIGAGKRLFGEGVRSELRLVESTPTTTGVIIARYER